MRTNRVTGQSGCLRQGTQALVLMLLIQAPLWSQSFTGQIAGTVSDQSGAVLPGVEIKVINLGTNAVRDVITNESGNYTVPGLGAGQYRVEANLRGFRTEIRTGIAIQVNQAVRLNFEMTIGDIAQTVEVTASAPLVETDSAALGLVINREQIDTLPLDGRNFLRLTFLTPGVMSANRNDNLAQRGGGAHIFGGRSTQNNFILDGVNNNDLANGEILLLPSVDALSEFKVQTSTFAPEFGRATGGVINLTTKGGTNEFHGTAFGFLRDDSMDARNTFAAAKPAFRRTQFGGTLGGRIVRDRTFFFVNYEGARLDSARNRAGLLPTRALKAGNFSELSTVIRDPATGLPFPGNIIPQSRFSTRARTFLGYFPDPQIDSLTQGNNFVTDAFFSQDVDQITTRIDHRLRDNHNLFVRYTFSDDFALDPVPSISIPGYGNDIIKNPQSVTIFLTSILSTNVVAESKVGYSRSNTVILSESGLRARLSAKELGLTEVEAYRDQRDQMQKFPDLSIAGFHAPSSGSGFVRIHNNWHLSESVSWTRQKHSFKFGAEYRREGMNLFQPGDSAGGFTFNRQFSGHNFADFLLGYPAQVSRQAGYTQVYPRSNGLGFFFQDDWKVSPRVTVNWGVRYETELAIYDKRDGFSQWNFETGKLEQLGVDGRSRRTWETDWNNWGPRLGLAWNLFGNGKTVIRTGAGYFYDALLHNFVNTMGANPPRAARDVKTATTFNSLSLDNPFPEPPVIAVTSNTNINTVLRDSDSAQRLRWSFSIAHELTNNIAVELAYVGSNSIRERFTNNPNQPTIIGNTNSRPYPQIGNISTGSTDGISNHQSGSLKFEQRTTAGLSYVASYTWSKTLEPGGVQDNYNRHAANRGPASYDRPHVFSLNSMYELPIGRGLTGAAAKILQGWQVAGIVSAQSGEPLTVTRTGLLPGFIGGNSLRPHMICDPKLDNPTPARWFKTECFVHPGDTFGTAGVGIIRAPGIHQYDLSLIKNTSIGENKNIQFRFEAFNAFNRPQYFAPNTSFVPGAIGQGTSSTTFGRIAQAGDPRSIQLGLKLFF